LRKESRIITSSRSARSRDREVGRKSSRRDKKGKKEEKKKKGRRRSVHAIEASLFRSTSHGRPERTAPPKKKQPEVRFGGAMLSGFGIEGGEAIDSVSKKEKKKGGKARHSSPLVLLSCAFATGPGPRDEKKRGNIAKKKEGDFTHRHPHSFSAFTYGSLRAYKGEVIKKSCTLREKEIKKKGRRARARTSASVV